MNELNDIITKKYLEGTCSEEDLNQISLWMKESEGNARQLFLMEEAYHLGQRNPAHEQKLTELAEAKLNKRLNQERAAKQKVLRIRSLMKYAAIITVTLLSGAGLGYWIHQSPPTVEMLVANAGNTIKIVHLADGTKIWLNHGATLTYPQHFSETQRNVYLEGEAYFEVAKNREKPFIVESESMRVRVLGTTFNFKSSKSCRVTEASLIEGEIEVKGNHEEGMIVLIPGQKAELNKSTGRLQVKQVNARMDGVWHDGLIPFEKANIFAIAKTLERFYDIKIILSPTINSSKTYSGVLKRKESIESVLQSLNNSIPIDYKIMGKNLFISSKNE